MKIRVELHNPLRGHCSCEHCGVPIINGDDDWHDFLAKQVSQAFGETYDGRRTDRKWFPAMMNKFAEMLSSKAENKLFCPYCGKAVEQPKISTITNEPVIPNVYANNFHAIEKWAKELNKNVPNNYSDYSKLRFNQNKDTKVIWI